MKQSVPKRPITAFFLFKETLTKDGKGVSGKVAGAKWSAMSDSQKKPFQDKSAAERAKYEKYLTEVEGVAPAKSGGSKEKPTSYSASHVHSVCTGQFGYKPMSAPMYKAMTSLIEDFVLDMGEDVAKELKADGRRMVTVEGVVKALENNPKFGFLQSMKEFGNAIAEAESAVAKEKEDKKKGKEVKAAKKAKKAKGKGK